MRKKRPLFYRYVTSYMMISVITVIFFSIFLYFNYISAAKDAALSEYRELLDISAVAFDEQLGSIYELSVVLQGRGATDTIRKMRAPIAPSDVPDINAFSRELQPYNYTSRSIQELILYFAGSDIFISSRSVGLYADVYYDVMLSYKDFKFQQWCEGIQNPQFMSWRRYQDIKAGEDYLDIMQELPYGYGGDKVLMIARINA